MRVEILDKAEDDLIAGFEFYEAQESGLGMYFLESLYSDIESLKLYRDSSPDVPRLPSHALKPISLRDILQGT